MLNVLVVTKENQIPGGLHYIDVPYGLCFSSLPGWANAANDLLDRAARYGGDALFLDDDVTLTAESLAGVRQHYADADIFGLDLHDLSGRRQAGARHVFNAAGEMSEWVDAGPAYVAHCSTSAIYLKASALGLRFPAWPGVHWEDVAFCLNAWLHGLRVLAVPGYVHHAIDGGVGATKRHTPAFWARWEVNRACFEAWCEEKQISAAIAAGAIPIGARDVLTLARI